MRTIVIVGGGSAGWMAAAYLNGALNKRGRDSRVAITLLESPDIPRISVGEATIPSMRHLLAVIGVDERDFMRTTDATFKQSIKYVNWVKNDNTFYHHPFSRYTNSPLDTSGADWLESDRSIPYMETVSAQPLLCEMGRAPLMLDDWSMGTPLSYAYHMNAQKFADYLRDFSIARGVVHVRANLVGVKRQDNGFISRIELDNKETLTGDLFVDCTGFKAKLIGETMGVKVEDCSKWLLCDQAITMHIPYVDHYPGMVRPYTTATALSSGWIWDIPMQSQRSIGYVHSSHFISDEKAELEMRAYQGNDTLKLPSRRIQFSVERRQKLWEGNCIAIGLSGGFIEPLESTGLYLSDLGAVALAEHFPFDDRDIDKLSYRYNRILSNRFYEILDFINMHYCLTKRDDTEFWRTVQRPEHINDRLKAKLEHWQCKPPTPMDFEDQCFFGLPTEASSNLTFPHAPVDTAALWNHESYLCILLGMNSIAEEYHAQSESGRSAPRVYEAVLDQVKQGNQKLPPHALWLQQKLGMKRFPVGKKPAGWVA